MFDKLKFNNLVISNKKKIQQARTITTQKLIQKIRKLKALQEKKPEDEKNKDRLRKNTENMAQLKQFKSIDIMRNVLLLEVKPSAVITNGRATPEEVAIALLAMNKIMLDLVKVFKSELKLDGEGADEDKTWRTEIAETSKRRAKIERTEEKRRKRLELKELKAVERKRTEWLKQNNNIDEGAENQKVQEDKKEKSSVAEDDGNDLTNAEDVQELQNIPSTKKSKSNKLNKPKVKPTEKKPQSNKIKRPRKKSSEKPPEKIKRFDSPLKEETSMTHVEKTEESAEQNAEEKTSINDAERREESAEEETSINHIERRGELEEDPNAEEEDNSITHVVDPFFITESGENYLSTAVVKLGQESHEDEDNKEEQYNQNRYGKRDNNNRAPRQQQEQHQGNRGRQEQNQSNKGRQEQKQGNRGRQEQHQGNRDFANRQQREFNAAGSRQPSSSNAQNKDNNRHPSWLAKEKIKPIINKFEGKKITFGDDGDTIVSVSNHNPTQSKDAPEAASGLHPSWVAKQKLKPKIATFEGKKITFDNDDE